jgi:tripartite-type tricarboxylate transporter receptor subunit TctC
MDGADDAAQGADRAADPGRRRLLRRITSAAGAPALAGLLAAPRRPSAQPAAAPAGWPGRPIRLIVPFPPGGATDLLARVLADRLTARLGQSVVVENRGGAGGNIAAEIAARAEPDGTTLFFASVGTAAINRHLYPRLNYRSEDLVPVVLWADLPNVAVVGKASRFQTLAELIAEARARPGTLSFASSGNGTTLHLSGELLKAMAGVDILHVPFRGGADVINQLLAGRVDVSFNNLPSAITLVRSGELRPLGLTGPERSPALPDLPTIAEQGYPGYQAVSWFGLQVVRGTSEGVAERLNAEVNTILAEPETRSRIEQMGARPRGGSAAEFAGFIAAESAKWADVIRASGAKLD